MASRVASGAKDRRELIRDLTRPTTCGKHFLIKGTKMSEVFDRGVLVGWMEETWISATRKAKAFIPRRDEDIEADRRGRK